MPGALQDLATEFARQLAAAGMFWLALAVVLLVAFVAVAARRGWVRFVPAPPAPRMPDVIDDPTRPDAVWGETTTDPEEPKGG